MNPLGICNTGANAPGICFYGGIGCDVDHLAAARAAALRLRTDLEEAKRDKYYKDAWYFYMGRGDVEAVVSAVLDSSHATSEHPVHGDRPDGGERTLPYGGRCIE